VTVQLAPILDEDVPAVAAFLHAHLNDRVSAEQWARMMIPPWSTSVADHGVLLRDGPEIVGVHLAFHAERRLAGRTLRLCNLGAWCVLPTHRLHSLKLLKALLAQPGVHFTDFSPSGNVVALNRRLGFRDLDTTSYLVPNLPWPSIPGGTKVVTDPAAIERLLDPGELALYRDHAGAGAARHAVLVRGSRHCWVMFRRDRRKGLPLFASVLHVGDPELFRDGGQRALARHLLLRHAVPATLLEERVTGVPRGPARRLSRSRPKMYRSSELGPRDLDYFYSELTCVAW
jgi:hypothetical protein